MAHVAITGAGGFVGSQLVPWLCSRGHEVRGVSSRPLPAALRACQAAEWRQRPDSFEDPGWLAVFAGIDCVVHLAARVHEMGRHDPGSYEQINSLGTARVLQWAIAAGVRRFVLLSTVKVHGEYSVIGSPIAPETAPAPVDPYGTSKLAAERFVLEASRAGQIEGVVIRPVLVYGPGVGANMARLIRWIASGTPLPLAAILNERSVLFLDNLCDLVATCIGHERAVGEVFLAADAFPVSTPEIVHALAAGLGVSPRMYSVPVPVLNALAALIGRRQMIRRLTDSLAVDISKNERLLGWTPPVSTAEGLARTATWFRERHRS